MNTTKSKPLANFLAIASIAMASVTAASADHHQPAEMLEGKVKQFYRQLSSGKFAEALDMMKDGACGYVAQGMRIDIANAQVKQYAAAQMQAGHDKGVRMALFPKHITIHQLADGAAVATFYIEGTVTAEGEEDEHFVNRGSLVFTQEGDDWKIAHFHISELRVEGDE